MGRMAIGWYEFGMKWLIPEQIKETCVRLIQMLKSAESIRFPRSVLDLSAFED